jgi:hypothetical protein
MIGAHVAAPRSATSAVEGKRGERDIHKARPYAEAGKGRQGLIVSSAGKRPRRAGNRRSRRTLEPQAIRRISFVSRWKL